MRVAIRKHHLLLSTRKLPCEQLVSPTPNKRETTASNCLLNSIEHVRVRHTPRDVIHLMSISPVNFVWNIAGFRCQANVRILRVY